MKEPLMCCVLNTLVRCKYCNWVKCDSCVGDDDQLWDLYPNHDRESPECSANGKHDDYLIVDHI